MRPMPQPFVTGMREDFLEEAALRNVLRIDAILDEYLDVRDRATEWDADKWQLPTIGMMAPIAAINHEAKVARDERRFCLVEPAKWEL
jgi:hypothetical protein